MKDFEKLLTGLPKPAVEVPEFKRHLRRELQTARHPRPAFRLRLALGAAASLAAALALLVATFVARPAIPARLHVALTGDPAPASIEAVLGELPIRDVLEQTEASAALDRAFIEDWSAEQSQPVQVRSMEAEKVYTVRQFELTDGKRMLVFTELAEGQDSYRAASPDPVRQVF